MTAVKSENRENYFWQKTGAVLAMIVALILIVASFPLAMHHAKILFTPEIVTLSPSVDIYMPADAIEINDFNYDFINVPFSTYKEQAPRYGGHYFAITSEDTCLKVNYYAISDTLPTLRTTLTKKTLLPEGSFINYRLKSHSYKNGIIYANYDFHYNLAAWLMEFVMIVIYFCIAVLIACLLFKLGIPVERVTR